MKKKISSLSKLCEPEDVIESAKKATGMILKQCHCYPPNVQKGIEQAINGTVQQVHVGKVKSNSTGFSLFDLSHAYIIFQFSTGEWVRCEIGRFLDGVAVQINSVQLVIYDEGREKFINKKKKVTIRDIIKFSHKYSEKGDYHIKKRNCFDYCMQTLLEFCDDGYQETHEWKQLEIDKVGWFKHLA